MSSLENNDLMIATILESLENARRAHVYLAYTEHHEQGPAENTLGFWSLEYATHTSTKAYEMHRLNGTAARQAPMYFDDDPILNSEVD